MLLVLLLCLGVVVLLLALLERQPPRERRLTLEQRMQRQEAAVAALLLRFEQLELQLEQLRSPRSPHPEPPTVQAAEVKHASGAAAAPPPPRAVVEPAPAPQAQPTAPHPTQPTSSPPPPPPPTAAAPPPRPAAAPPRPPAYPSPAPPDRRQLQTEPSRPSGRWRQRWRRWERRLIANWTGLLGVVVVVAGVTFAAINVALGFNPWQRFLLVAAAAALMALPSMLLRASSPWRRLSLWLRSGGAALLLFACTAAGGLPHLGLRWLNDPGQSLALLCAAMAVNLLLAAVASSQTVAGLHVVVCLVPLTIAPQGGLILAVASLVALVGVVLPMARPWYGHRLLVGVSYSLFHVSWALRILPQLAGSPGLRQLAALGAALVFTTGTVLLQRPQRLRQHTPTLPLLAQLVNSAGLGLALLLEPPGAIQRALALAACAGLMAVLARRAQLAELSWLRRCNVVLAQAFTLAALLSLAPWLANATLLAALVLLECLAVLHLGHRDDDPVVRQLGWWMSLLAALALVAVSLADHLVLLATAGGSGAAATTPLQNSGVVLGCGSLALASQRRVQQPAPLPAADALGWIGALLLWLGSSVIGPPPWQPWLGLAVLAAALLAARRWPLAGAAEGLAVVVGLLHLGGWQQLLQAVPWPMASLAELTLPPVLLALLLLFVSRQEFPRQVGWLLLNGTALVLLLSTLLAQGESPDELRSHALTLLAAGQLLPLLLLRLRPSGIRVPLPQALAWQGAALTDVAITIALPWPWRGVAGLLAFGSLLLMAWRWRPSGLLAAAGAGITLVHLQLWLELLGRQPWTPQAVLQQLLPLAALALLLRLIHPRTSVPGLLRALPIYLLGIGAGLAGWLLLAPVSTLIPPVAWLLLALVALDLANRRPAGDGRHLLILAVGLLLAYAVGYGLLVSQSPVLLALGGITVPGRLCIELLGLAVLLYGWFLPSGATLRSLNLWRHLHPLLLEALLLGAVVTVLSEVDVLWRPLVWAALALLAILRPVRRQFAPRLQIYGVLLYWLSLATLLAALSTLESPVLQWFLQPGAIALLTMGLQVGFIAASHRQLDPALLGHSGWGPLHWIGDRVSRRPHRWLYLPFFAVVAHYLWLRYDRALLTLLWTAEAFVIYGLSAVLRDAKFRLLALVALGACLLRLVAIDMAQADLGIRGAVFIGVGLLMVAMNALYNRFRSRFESSEASSQASSEASRELEP